MTNGSKPSATASTNSLEARQAQFDHPRLLTPSEIESLKQDFESFHEWAKEELRRNPMKLRDRNTEQNAPKLPKA